MSFPPLARVRQSVPQPRVEDVAGHGPPADPASRSSASGCRPGGRSPWGSAAGGSPRSPGSPGRRSTRSRRWASGRSSSPRWGATAARPPRASASCSPATASPPRRWASRSGPTWTPWSWGPTPSACRSTSTGTPTRPTGSSCSTGSSRTPTSAPRTSRASSRCWSSAWASARGPSQVHKLGLRGMKRGPARGRPVPGREHQVRPRPGDPRERRRPARRDRRGRARDDLRRRAAPARRARALMGRLPFDQIDVLVVGELGKNYSGAGSTPT